MSWGRGTIAQPAICGLLLVAIVGCAGTRREVTADCASVRLTAVTAPSERVEFPLAGFSVTPPQGEHWCIANQDSTRGIMFSTAAFLGRQFNARPPPQVMANTLGAVALVLDPSEQSVDTPEGLRTYAEYFLRKEPGRFRSRETQVSPEQGLSAECVRANQISEERHNPNMPGAVLVLVNRQILCRHPDSPRRILLIGASERYLEGDPGPHLLDLKKDQIDGFIQSLRFMSPR